jgi:hypothetical protein
MNGPDRSGPFCFCVCAVAAFFGAHSGGNHRDGAVTSEFFVSRARVVRRVLA